MPYVTQMRAHKLIDDVAKTIHKHGLGAAAGHLIHTWRDEWPKWYKPAKSASASGASAVPAQAQRSSARLPLCGHCHPVAARKRDKKVMEMCKTLSSMIDARNSYASVQSDGWTIEKWLEKGESVRVQLFECVKMHHDDKVHPLSVQDIDNLLPELFSVADEEDIAKQIRKVFKTYGSNTRAMNSDAFHQSTFNLGVQLNAILRKLPLSAEIQNTALNKMREHLEAEGLVSKVEKGVSSGGNVVCAGSSFTGR